MPVRQASIKSRRVKSVYLNAHYSLFTILYYREEYPINKQCTATACKGGKQSVDFPYQNILYWLSCRSYMLHHSVNVCRWELEGLLEKYYSFTMALTFCLNTFSLQQKGQTETLEYTIFFWKTRGTKWDLKKWNIPSGQAILGQRNNTRQEKMWMPYTDAGVQTHGGDVVQQCALREMTWPWRSKRTRDLMANIGWVRSTDFRMVL